MAHVRRGGHVLGLCGGYQMLGRSIADPDGIEGPAGDASRVWACSMSTTVLTPDKIDARRCSGAHCATGAAVAGYEIHLGRTDGPDCARPLLDSTAARTARSRADGRVQGSYVHGLFTADDFRRAWLAHSAAASQLGLRGRASKRRSTRSPIISKRISTSTASSRSRGGAALVRGPLRSKAIVHSEAPMTSSPRLAFLIMVATVAYLGLAVLGQGGFAAFFSHPALIALTIVVFLMAGVSLFTGGNLSPGEREDRANRWVLVSLRADRAAGRLSAGLHGPEGLLDPRRGLPFAGLASFSSPPAACCGSGRSLCSAVGSAGWSPSSPGIRWSRMASTASSATPAIWGCSSTRWGGLWPFARASACCSRRSLIPPLLARIRAEERLLRAHFGDAYDAYCSRTSRLLPGLY